MQLLGIGQLHRRMHHSQVDMRQLTKPDTFDDAELLNGESSSGMPSPAARTAKLKRSAPANQMALLNVNSSDQPYRQSYTELSQKRAECRCSGDGWSGDW